MPAEETGTKLVGRALELIAAENQRQGLPAGQYDEARFAIALGTAVEELGGPDDDLSTALAQIHGAAEMTVSAGMLRDRQQEILAEEGFPRTADGRLLAPNADRVLAMRQAIDELGEPGQPRKDLAAYGAERRDALMAAAADAGLLAGEPAVQHRWKGLYDKDPAGTERLLAAMGVAVDDAGEPVPTTVYSKPGLRDAALAFSAVDGEHLVTPDEDGLRQHVQAEALIESKGWGTKKPVTGEVVYDADTYMRALEEIERTDRNAAARAVEAETAKAAA